ncbi:hypothetical protein MTR67_013120 [Solanum verrucosum]|uniref:Glycosyltransferase n=1 Tax=Solanum verrucosum TaxID=315347 RepID=A0AAF0TNI5_SOLVR|nr:hypothetical protein MTR67_013120 [Solanum verrucosum]
MKSSGQNQKPHAVCIPFPAQGHINPMLNLAKLLHYKGFHITFVHTEFNYKRILLESSDHESLNSSSSFRFETIPDGLISSDALASTTQDLTELCVSTQKNLSAPFRSLLDRIDQSTDDENIPAVSCIVSDGFMSFTIDAAEQLGIPHVLFYTLTAMTLLCFFQYYPQIIERRISPPKDDSYLRREFMEQTIDWIPGIGSIRLGDIPTPIWATNSYDPILNFIIDQCSSTIVNRSSAVLIHTFDALEPQALTSLSSIFNRIYTIGPLSLLAKQISPDTCIEKLRSNLWRNDSDCIEWLDSRDPASVIYVNFGSTTVMTSRQFEEFGWGLANSMKNFLWIVRPDLVISDDVVPLPLPPEYLFQVKDRGKIVTWCDQVLVLEHPAIGGFLTHCGWNSIFESLSLGVPMLCWPFFGDQQTNRMCCCKKWGVGIEIEEDVKREEIERIVKEVMEGEKGKEIKRKAMEWKQEIQKAVNPNGGSSYLNLDKLIEEVLLC